MPAAALVAHARSKEPVLPPNVGNGEGNEYGTALLLPGTTHANGPGWPGPEGMRLGAHIGGQATGALAGSAAPRRTHILAGIAQVPPLFRKADTMTLFIAIHQHAAEHCPAGDPAMGPALLSHLSPATADQYGVVVQAEAVANAKHTLYLIAEAGDEEQLRRYLAPFAHAGSVQVLPASSCEAVIDRGGCTRAPA